MTFKVVAPVVGLFALAACGGGGGTVSNPIDLSDFPNASYGDLDTATDFLKGYANSPLSTAIPTDGRTTTYYGIFLMGEDLSTADSTPTIPTGYIGQVRLNVDYDASSYAASGTAQNFYQTSIDADGDPGGSTTGSVGGSLNLSSGASTGANFSLSVSGVVDSKTISGTLDTEIHRTTSNPGAVAIVGATDPLLPLNVSGVTGGYDAVLAAD